MTLTNFAATTTFALIMSISPGPNNLMVAVSGANFGFKRTLPHMLGISVGFPIMLALVGIGMGEIFITQPRVQEAMYILGNAYLLYLAYLIANRHPSHTLTGSPKPFSFLQAALFQWVNPKAWVMALSTIATFTSTNNDLLRQIALMCLIFFGVALPSVSLWTFFGSALSRKLNVGNRLNRFNKAMAFLLLLSVALNFF